VPALGTLCASLLEINPSLPVTLVSCFAFENRAGTVDMYVAHELLLEPQHLHAMPCRMQVTVRMDNTGVVETLPDSWDDGFFSTKKPSLVVVPKRSMLWPPTRRTHASTERIVQLSEIARIRIHRRQCARRIQRAYRFFMAQRALPKLLEHHTTRSERMQGRVAKVLVAMHADNEVWGYLVCVCDYVRVYVCVRVCVFVCMRVDMHDRTLVGRQLVGQLLSMCGLEPRYACLHACCGTPMCGLCLTRRPSAIVTCPRCANSIGSRQALPI
jgi:hypothetical protein